MKCLNLSQRLSEKARMIGDGNFSEGVRRAIETYNMETHQPKPIEPKERMVRVTLLLNDQLYHTAKYLGLQNISEGNRLAVAAMFPVGGDEFKEFNVYHAMKDQNGHVVAVYLKESQIKMIDQLSGEGRKMSRAIRFALWKQRNIID